MSFGVDMVFGSGAPQVQILGLGALGTITLADPVECDVTFTPERYDGGPIQVRLADGQLVYRADGYRMRVALRWEGLTAAQQLQVQQVISLARTYGILFNPHDDVNFWQRVYVEGDVALVHTGGIYVAHSPSLTVVSAGLLSRVPTVVGNGTPVAVLAGDYGFNPF